MPRKPRKAVAFFEIKGWEMRYLRRKLPDYDLLFFENPLSLENVPSAVSCDILSVFIYSKITKEIVSRFSRLTLLTTRSTGFDHIQISECKKKGIVVCNVPFYGENTVAEHTFALILSLSRNVHKSYLRTLRGDYSIEGLQGFDLQGKTIGVVGAGRIGLHVIRIAQGFGMRILVADPHQDKFLASILGFHYAPLEELLAHSDIITLHLPHTETTHHLINKQNVSLIKRGALFINTSRGGLVDPEALNDALDQGILSGAGLDVLEGEEFIKEDKQLLYDKKNMETLKNIAEGKIILRRDNVVFTPHIGFYSHEALERILETTVQNIQSFIQGAAQNRVV